MNGMVQDLRHAFRQLRKNPGFTAVAVMTLALGIGVNVATFSFVDELWLHSMPVKAPDRIVRIFTSNPSSHGEIERGYSSYPDFRDLRTSTKTLAGIAALDNRGAQLDDGKQSILVTAAVVSENFFDVLQPSPVLGRMFTEREFQNSPALSVVLSYPFWRRQFNGDPALPGHTIIVDSQPVNVLGILPRGFRGSNPVGVPNLWLPQPTWQQLTGERERQNARGARDYELFGRLKNGMSQKQAKAEIGTLASALASAYPASNTGYKMTVAAESETRGELANVSLVLLGVAALVVLIACANVAGLLMARAEYRRKEIATRMALGASRANLLRQFLTETALLAALATVASLLLGNFVLDQLPNFLPQTGFSIGVDPHLNSRALLFAAMTAAASLFLFALVPVLQATRIDPGNALKQASDRTSTPRRILRSVLVIAQVALSLVMVVCSGLLVRSVIKALAIDPGFNAHQKMLIAELVPAFGTKSDRASMAFVYEARQRLGALPGMTATAIAMRFPFGTSGGGATRRVFPVAESGKIGAEGATINYDPVGEGYFSVLGTRILRGRAIEQHDLDMNAHVMVVNQTMAKRFWPNDDAVGQRVHLGQRDGDEYEVIGIAEDGMYNDVREVRMPYLFLPMKADDYGELALAVKTSVDPETVAPAVRRVLRELNQQVPILSMVTLREHMREALYEERLMAELIGAMGALGLVLAAIGIYGLMAFLVGRRTPEIGIRMAMGARRGGIFRLVIGHALRLMAIGTVIGVAGAIAAAQAMRSMLFGIAAADSLTIAIAVVVLGMVAFAAAAVPAAHAAKVDPMVALRYE
ncbi:MAG: ABC transporter permease [Terriglobales bacterium]